MSERVNIADVITNIKDDGQRMGKDLVALGQAEMKPIAKNAGIGGGAFGAAGYLALNAASLLFVAGGFAFSLIFFDALSWNAVASLALGFVCMAVVLLVIAAIAAVVGKGALKKVGPPQQTIDEAKASVEAIKASVQRGKDTVAANQLARAGLAAAKKQAKDLSTR